MVFSTSELLLVGALINQLKCSCWLRLGSAWGTEAESWSKPEWTVCFPSERNSKDISWLWESAQGSCKGVYCVHY